MRPIKLFILVTLLLTAPVISVFAQATTNHEHNVQQITLDIENACPSGEPVEARVVLSIVSQVTITPSGSYHVQSLLHMQGQGDGIISGDKYHINQILKSQQSSSTSGFTFTSPARILITRLGTGEDYTTHVLVHYTVDKDGNVKAAVNYSTFVCK